MGAGVVTRVEGRFGDVFFPQTGEQLRLLRKDPASRAVVFQVGDVVKRRSGRSERIIELNEDTATFENGTSESLESIWPVIAPPSPRARLMKGELDAPADIASRVDAARLAAQRRGGRVAGLIGGRIELFPHQLDTARRAIADDHVRWMLADEVGLGKTVVACLITSALLRMERTDSVVVIAPDSLTVQWLGELYRKFHQIFVHVDAERVEAVTANFGEGTNPFEVHPMAVVSLELLAKRPELVAAIAQADPRMVVVDEAHHVVAPGNEATSVDADSDAPTHVLDLVRGTRHALLLTTTPFQHGQRGFEQLASALRLPISAAENTEVGRMSVVTRGDVAQFPKRRAVPVDIGKPGAVSREDEPRVAWLSNAAKEWHANKEKALIFVESERKAADLARRLETTTGFRAFVFAEGMNASQRDIELAEFRTSPSPLMVTSGAGSEGRNFQFCDHLVHFDLPEDPLVLEQRIGRLDRIGRTADVPVVYFRAEGAAGDLARDLEARDLFATAHAGARVEGYAFPDTYQSAHAMAVLAGIPEDAAMLTERFCVDAAERVGVTTLEKDGESTYYFEFGENALVDTIPGVEHGTRFLGTFDRQTAIDTPGSEFFANGHPLVEGLLQEMDDSLAGRTGALEFQHATLRGPHLLMMHGHELTLVDGDGNPPEDLDEVPILEQVAEALHGAEMVDPDTLAELLHTFRSALSEDADALVVLDVKPL